MAAGTTGGVRVINNIIYGFTTGVNHADSGNLAGYSDYNAYFNNTTARTNWLTGANDIATNPGFANTSSNNYAVSATMKFKGFPGVFPGALTTGYLDIGAVQRHEYGKTVNKK